jgi:serine protease Do
VTDLAVIKIDGRDLPVAPLGDSSKLEIGETVIAIGNPLGLEGGPTVTVGVVSAVARSIEDPGGPTLHDLIQTDAAINPGNSGGPLVRMAGDVIGINTAIIQEAQGIGFAISINSAKPIIQELVAHGRVVRPAIGIAPVGVTPQLASGYDLPVDRGVLVARLDPRGPAAKAGMRSGDVIVAVAGHPVKNVGELRTAIGQHKIGETERAGGSPRGGDNDPEGHAGGDSMIGSGDQHPQSDRDERNPGDDLQMVRRHYFQRSFKVTGLRVSQP